MARITSIEQPPALKDYVRLTESGMQNVRPEDAAVVLGKMARDLAEISQPALVERFILAGRRLATTQVMELLLEAAANRGADTALVAGALRFRGSSVVGVVLGRLSGARTREERQPYFELVLHLGTFPEMRETLIDNLEAGLNDGHGETGRNAIALLAALDAQLPCESLQTLVRSPHAQVRLALTQVVSRWRPTAEGLRVLCAMISDAHDAVRDAAGEGIRRYRVSLERCVASEGLMAAGR